jgi:hypothetical protein
MPMNIPDALAAVERVMVSIQEVKAALTTAPEPVQTVVRAGENLQAALDQAGAIELDAEAFFEGTYFLRSNTVLTAKPGAAIRGKTGPALMIPPGTSDVGIFGLEAASTSSEVIRIGENSPTQTTVEDAPRGIILTHVRIPRHRGKRGIAIHGRDVTLLNCEVLDCWDPAGQDSQAIYIGNAPGPITIRGGRYSAGSEVVLLGGDATQIPHVTPTDILVEDVELFRPLSWLGDGVPRKVKNIFEVKNGRNVTLRTSHLHGCWANGQQGEAIVLTPALDGAKTDPPLRSGEVTNVLVEDVTVTDCSSLVGILGRAYSAYTVEAASGIVFRRVAATLNRAQFGGRGQLATIGGEPEDVTFEDCTVTQDGTSLVYYSPGTCLDPVTKLSRAAGKLGALTLKNSRCTLPTYGIMLGGVANAVNWQASVGVLDVKGNVFGGSNTAMKKTLVENEYLTRLEFDTRLQIQP